MKRKIRPAEEEMGNVVFLILFVILWYSSLIGSFLTGGTHTTALLFFCGGIASGVYRRYYDTKSIVLPQAAGRGYRIRIFTAWLDPECGTAGCSLSVRKK